MPMASDEDDTGSQRWARLRFAIVGPLLAAPPGRGQLRDALASLAAQTWKHPSTGEATRFGVSTIERWYYRAKNEHRDPVGVLRRRVRRDVGGHPSLAEGVRRALSAQYREHTGWSTQLHYDNLVALAKEVGLGSVPSYTTVRRYMRAHAMVRVRPTSRRQTEGTERAAQRLERLEVRSFEATHVHGLWHLDFHEGSRKVLLSRGQWVAPQLLGVLDDRSRLCCHLQWYLDETSEALVHGLSQAMQKRGLPRALMTDNGGAMRAEETWRGLEELGVVHERTLAASPYQNGKQESFWGQVEGRLLPMLDGVELDLRLLNDATQAWVELEYNKKVHSELGVPPIRRYLEGPDVGRPCPDSEVLRCAFRRKVHRTQRRSDGTIQLEAQRYELPSRLRQMPRVLVRYAQWDLARVDVVDPNTHVIIARVLPLDKARNADGQRRRLQSVTQAPPPVRSGEPAPLLRQLMRQYSEMGLPPGYLPRRERTGVVAAVADGLRDEHERQHEHQHDDDHDNQHQRDEEDDR